MNIFTFEVVKHFVRGDKKGKRVTEFVDLEGRDGIHNFLWDITEKYDKNRLHFVIEWYKQR